MARLHSIDFAGWKSIHDITPGLELGPINVLIGANGSGKSNFVSFFRLLREIGDENLQTHVGQSGGADSVLHNGSKVTSIIRAGLEFELDSDHCFYSINLEYAIPNSLLFLSEMWGRIVDGMPYREEPDSGDVIHSETGLTLVADRGYQIAQNIRNFLRQVCVFHFHDTSEKAKIRQSGYIEANQSLYSDGGNLAAMLYLYQQAKPMVYRRIVSTIQKIMPTFDGFVLGPQRLNPKNILLNWKQKSSNYLFGPHQLSDGTLRAMALITLFLQPSEDLPSIIIVDEPELGLHPHAIEIIAGLIRAASLKTQIILTTQSTTFLDHFEPEEIIVVDDRQGNSQFRHLNLEELKYWLKDYSVGRLWEKNVLGGGPLS